MNGLVFHIASGQAFFSGVAFVIVAAMASTHSKPIVRRSAVLAFLIGVIAIVVSSTAISWWYYAFAAVVTLAWIASRFVIRAIRIRCWSPFAVVAAWLVAALIELPHHIVPSLSPAPSRSLTVIGDSITAGVGGDETSQTWPGILASEHDLLVHDLSQMGETAGSALKHAMARPIDSHVVIVEIGGNDLLGSTSCAQFAHDLDALLKHIAAPERQIVMFELPLPPFCHEYGRNQRALARKYNVRLVPKRVLLSIIADGDSTLDSIHLTQAGHRRMAACVWQLVQSAFPTPRARGLLASDRPSEWGGCWENRAARQCVKNISSDDYSAF